MSSSVFPARRTRSSESLALCRRVGFSRMHVFRYSKRPGTLAADMPDQVPPEVMAERSRRMRAAAQELAIADARRRVGTVERAVLEYGDNLTLGSFHHARLDDTCGLTAPCLLDVAIIESMIPAWSMHAGRFMEASKIRPYRSRGYRTSRVLGAGDGASFVHSRTWSRPCGCPR